MTFMSSHLIPAAPTRRSGCRVPPGTRTSPGSAGVPLALVVPAISAPSFPRKRESRCSGSTGVPPASADRRSTAEGPQQADVDAGVTPAFPGRVRIPCFGR